MRDGKERERERDLVLGPNEYAFILDETKGNVISYVGPHKTSLANTDRPVIFDETTRCFTRCNLEETIKPWPFAEEGWYILLENPAKSGDEEHPKSGPNNLPGLTYGRAYFSRESGSQGILSQSYGSWRQNRSRLCN